MRSVLLALAVAASESPLSRGGVEHPTQLAVPFQAKSLSSWITMPDPSRLGRSVRRPSYGRPFLDRDRLIQVDLGRRIMIQV
jgi:hypothetical protein